MFKRTKLGYSYTMEWSEEDRLFLCKVEKLPGCMADGLTEEDAVSNLEMIVNEWLETAKELGREIPEP